MPPVRTKRDPRTKEDFLDRMLRYDFDGDIRNLGGTTASIVRIGANALRLTFPDSGVVFDLTVHRPREENKQAAAVREAVSAGQRAQEPASFAQDADEEPAPVDETPRRRKGRQPAANAERRQAAN